MALETIRRIIVSDIFGLTDELEAFRDSLDNKAIILDPYNSKRNQFIDEERAYQYFQRNCGIERYAEYVFEQVTKIAEAVEAVSLIGFSVGASAIWNCSQGLSQQHVSASHLFYGSQIRHALNISPRIPITVILPEYEDHFSIKALSDSLRSVENVTVEHSLGLHGFMNKLSTNFNPTEYEKYVCTLNQLAN